ncbi:biopolymer transporter ExbD [Parabacteroides sp. OttesenSCG-928-G07]|nr:biopolymer transporter ExbD [Parabacteroides sp. OttesenSCG-928-G21]MDL2278785.1 biopolymer transporter ExbD [Parabacteroides sp. OttesenSCG-928-G07]
MGSKKKTPGINGTSSADIAFMLLIFFLITTSMDTDRGLARRLPQPVPKDHKAEDTDIKKRNLLVVLINSSNQILCGNEFVELSQLKDKVKDFIDNPNNDENKPEKIAVDVPFFGTRMVTKNHVISLQNDRGTEYQAYINVQNELAAAYNELRDDISRRQFGKVFIDLSEEEQAAVQEVYPQRISEAEPKNYGGVN